MPKVKTGETVTVSLSVDLKYRCSSCGKDNVVPESLSSSAHTGTLMGVNLSRNLHEQATEALNAKLKCILNQNDPHRFRNANFTCKCKYCGHREPWASIDSERFNKISLACLCVLICSVFLLPFVSLNPFDGMSLLFLLPTVFGVAGLVGTIIYKSKNCVRMAKLIAKLPPESLPTLLPHEPAIKRALRDDTMPRSAEQIEYDTWECNHCGTTNTLKYAQCKKCGQYKGT